MDRTRRTHRWLVWPVLALAVGGFPPAAGEEARVVGPYPAGPHEAFRVRVEADAEGRDRLVAAEFDISGHDLPNDAVEVVTHRAGLLLLEHLGFEYTVIESRTRPLPLGATEGGPDVPLPDQKYTNPVELEAFLNQVVADHPAITRLVDLGPSLEGRPIRGLLVSDNAAVDEDELTILFSGAHHAREVMTPEVVMDMIDQLTDNYGIDPAMTARVDDYQIWLVPMVNPDGVHIVHTADDFWRKNARDNDGDMDLDGNDGVDLNRNYEWGWGGQCQGSSSTFSSQTYRGTSEASEPEMTAMIGLGRRILPVFDVEYHSYGEDVFYAMSCDPIDFNPKLTTVTGPDQDISRVIAEGLAAEIVQADGGPGFTSAPYGSRVDGTGRDQQYHESGAIGFVVEINNSAEGGFHPDYDTWRQPTVEGLRPGWIWLIDRMAGPAIGGVVRDAQTQAPVAADLSLDEAILPDGKRWTSRGDTGRFHLIVVPGNYTLRVSAPGYVAATVPLTVGSSWAPINVDLQPTGSAVVIEEDFEDPVAAALWTAGIDGNVTSGFWVHGEPEGTFIGTVQGNNLDFGNPKFDRTPGEGHRAYVTGNQIGAGFADDDVDGGTVELTSPAYDLSGLYAVELSWQRWFRNESSSQDVMELELSDDGGSSWVTVATWDVPSTTADASPAWVGGSTRIDDWFQPSATTRLRFRVGDRGADDVVEGAVDDVVIRGFSLATHGDIGGVRVDGASSTVVTWDPAPGAPDAVYDVVRGDLANLSGGGSGVDLGPLTCIEEDSVDTSTAGNEDSDVPAVNTGRFYLVRFKVGFSLGGYGRGTEGGERSGSGGCSP